MQDSFGCKRDLKVADSSYKIFDINALPAKYNVGRLPYSLKIILENLLRHEDNLKVSKTDIEAVLKWQPTATPSYEISYMPARVILQDFTGVPAIVDLAAMRDAIIKLGGDPNKINPISQVDLVIDHSVIVDVYGTPNAYQRNTAIEFERNKERYSFLNWGQNSLSNFSVVPPGTGIVHQVNLEYLAKVVFAKQQNGENIAYPDTVIGTDSHTTMIDGLGVLGWGVGGIEAEAAMLGQPVTMLIPEVIGFELTGSLPELATATDLVLTVVEMLRKKGVVGKFVEFFGSGLDELPVADRATIGNMAPEYGATCGIFPIDKQTLDYLQLSGRPEEQIALVEAYAKAQGLFRDSNSPTAEYTDTLHLDLSTVQPSIAGPKRPQDRIALTQAKQALQENLKEQNKNASQAIAVNDYELKNGAVVIAAITSCTNTSNPDVMIGAALLARNANKLGLTTKPWVKTSLAPGSKVVTDYYDAAGLTADLDALGFYLVGYGCTTCIGNSGPLAPEISKAINDNNLTVCSVLSGNRNFEGRIHPDVQNSYLASPMLVVAYALTGTVDFDFQSEALGQDQNGKPILLKDIWPSKEEIHSVIKQHLRSSMFTEKYQDVFAGDDDWAAIQAPPSEQFSWDANSTYVRNPPYFTDMQKQPNPISNIKQAKVLVMLGDMVTTDHISPAGAISKSSAAAKYLLEHGVEQMDFNSYGSRRGNHEVLMRGTFGNIRLKNLLVPGKIGSYTIYQPDQEQMSIFDAAMRYQEQQTPLIVIAGKEYGAGSSRDWAAKGPRLLGVRAIIAESFERIHRSNLIGMGVLPLTFTNSENAQSLSLTGFEDYSINLETLAPNAELLVQADNKEFTVKVCINTPMEFEYYKNGGILQYVIRTLLAA